MDIATRLTEIRARANLSPAALAQLLGTSLVSVSRWERGAGKPSPAQAEQIQRLYQSLVATPQASRLPIIPNGHFASRGARRQHLPLFDALLPTVELAGHPFPAILARITSGRYFAPGGARRLAQLLETHAAPAVTAQTPPAAGMSAGKNTYTYDAHTYHTKVPPQGIAELLAHYLPQGGLVLDPFAGSGMTGVAARSLGYDCILNELSPAACFIADRFTSSIEPAWFQAGVTAVLNELSELRADLYTTTCRECEQPTEMLYTVWSYNVICSHCAAEFLLWDHCRRYGRIVREHKILAEFPCPHCQRMLKKSKLQRTTAEPVLLGYKCCGSAQQEVTHPPAAADLERMQRLAVAPPLAEGCYPQTPLPEGVNLRQPAKHGLDRVDRFYTPRNLAAMSHLWRAIHRVESPELAAYLAFVFTSLYQRVTRLAEFRFWGGSGNTARFNVPFICNEANVFQTFARKARSIQDHLEATAAHYRGTALVVQHSATALDYLPDASIDLIFTDPPFGANINYSEMNILWESWLGAFTPTTEEAIVNKVQQKGIAEYQALMTQSLRECYRVLRPGHWLLLVFMNSSHKVWAALRAAILEAGFTIENADMFDKQHGTFKHFVSDNTAGYDLVLHCRKPATSQMKRAAPMTVSLRESIIGFLQSRDVASATNVYLHVKRQNEIDFRKLYSEWLSQTLPAEIEVVSFAEFRAIARACIEKGCHRSANLRE